MPLLCELLDDAVLLAAMERAAQAGGAKSSQSASHVQVDEFT